MKKETNQKIENEIEFTNEQLGWIFGAKYAEQDVTWDWTFHGGLTDDAPDNIGHSDVDDSIELHLNMDGICADSGAELFWVYTTDARKADLTDFLHARWPDLDFSIMSFPHGEEEQSSEVSV